MAETIVKLDLTKVSGKHTVGIAGRSLLNEVGGLHNLGSPAAAGTDFGTGDFTVEGWFNILEIQPTFWSSVLGNFNGSDTGSWSLFVTNGSTPKLNFVVDGVSSNKAATTITAREWHHFAVSRTAGVLRIFLDGVLDLKEPSIFAGSIGGTGDVRIGWNAASTSDKFDGWIDELRVTKGVSRYFSDASFTVPTEPYFRFLDVTFDLLAATGAVSLTGQAAQVVRVFSLSAEVGALALTGQTVQVVTTRILSADVGTVNVVGQTVQVSAAQDLVAEVGAVSLTGQAAQVRAARRLSAEAGTLSAVGQDVQVSRVFPLSAEAGSVSVSAAPAPEAGLSVMRRLSATNHILLVEGRQASVTISTEVGLLAAAGSFVSAGEGTALTASRVLSAEAGFVTLSQNPAGWLHGRAIQAAGYTASVTGQAVGLIRLAFRRVAALTGAVVVTGPTASVHAARHLAADVAALSAAGQVAGIGRTLTLTTDPGQMVATTLDAPLRAARTLKTATGGVAWAGYQVGLSTAVEFSLLASRATLLTGGQLVSIQTVRYLSTAAQGLTLGTSPVPVHVARTLTAASGALSVTGVDADVTTTTLRSMAAATGDLSVTGQTAQMRASRVLSALAGAVATTVGQVVSVHVARALGTVAGSVALTGLAAVFADKLTSAVGALAVTGQAVALVRGRRVAAEVAGLADTGVDVVLSRLRTIAAAVGEVDVSASTGGMRAARVVVGETTEAALGGQPVGLDRDWAIRTEASGWAVTAPAATVQAQRHIAASVGAVDMPPNSAQLLATTRLPVEQASYSAVGQPVSTSLIRKVVAVPVSVELVGSPSNLYHEQIILSQRRSVTLTQSPLGVTGESLVGGEVGSVGYS